MGVMRFAIHPSHILSDWPEVHQAYISGLDGRVFATRVEIDDDILICRRQNSDSGKLHVAWPITGFGKPVIKTASLSEREKPYLLPLELARGQISEIRTQAGNWEMLGMKMPESFREINKKAYQLFSQAASIQHDLQRASELACDALSMAFEASELLSAFFSEQQLEARRNHLHRLPASLGCNLGSEIPDPSGETGFLDAFNSAVIPIEWRNIEPIEGEYDWKTNDAQVDWCKQNNLLMYGGPLLDLSPRGLPDWVVQWENDVINLQSFVSDFVETAISRYVGKIRNWEIAARANSGGALTLNEESRLAIVARTIETARQVDDEIQITIGVDQPWGDYQARGQHRLSPMQFVDVLTRSGLGLSGVTLEIAVGYQPRCSGSRGSLEISKLIDEWSYLGLPLHIALACPSASQADPTSNSDLEVDPGLWKGPWNEETQAEWIDQHLPILMARDSVVGISWTHYSDAGPHHYPHAGLVRPDGTPKSGLDHIVKYRRTYWKADN